MRFGNLTLSAGLRWDHYSLVVKDNAWSPRLGAFSLRRRCFGRPTAQSRRSSAGIRVIARAIRHASSLLRRFNMS